MEETLRSLRDVDGVQGSFVLGASGVLVARDLPAIFDGPLFSEVGPRIARLYETFLSSGEEMDACLLRFSEHKLYLRKMKGGLLGTISGATVNLPALRMVVNLVIRRIDPMLARASIPPALTPAPSPASTGPTSSPTLPSTLPSTPFVAPPIQDGARAIADEGTPMPSSHRHVRMHRGRRVEE